MKIDFENKGFTHGSFSIEGTDYNINYVSIPEGTKLYHGNNFEQGNNILVGDLKYFLINPDHAEDNQYGIMHEFETTIPLNLIRLDDKATQDYLYDTSNKEIQKILERNFGYNNGIRDSEKYGDAKVAERVCELCKDSNYHGYLTDVMNTDMGGRFHPEIVICNPSDKLNFVETVTPPEEGRKIKKDMELKYRGDQEKGYRKKKPSYGSQEEKSIAPLHIGLESYDSPTGSSAGPVNTLFGFETPPATPPATPGGKKSKKKKSKKKGTKRKTKRKSSKNKRKKVNK